MGEEERQEVEKGKKKLILIVVLLFGAIALGIGAYKILAGSMRIIPYRKNSIM